METELPVFRLRRGAGPLVVSIPHAGTHVPAWLHPRLSGAGVSLDDTDWHLENLYDFLEDLDATVLVATHTRYVIDLNRPRDDASLYPGQSTTGLCPVDTFSRQPVYIPGSEPDIHEVDRRIASYWQPYHDALAAELERLKGMHDQIVLWDAHSIRSCVSRFFAGELPHLNIGTADHASCSPELVARLERVLRDFDRYTWVVNGRFKGGYITRHYGRPDSGIHALQLEMAMRTYMNESGAPVFDEAKAKPARTLVRALLESLLD